MKIAIKDKHVIPSQSRATSEWLYVPPERKTPSRPSSVFLHSTDRDLHTHVKEASQVPGPGHYSISNRKRELGRFQSGAPRFEKEVHWDIPSPCDYVTIKRRDIPRKPTSQFASKTVSREIYQSTPPHIGPGCYEPQISAKVVRGKGSPAFVDGATRLFFDQNANPAPGDYQIDRRMEERGRSILNSRYENRGDFYEIRESPSPDSYVIDRELHGVGRTIPRGEYRGERRNEKIGPGSYDTNVSSMRKRSYNVNVPGFGKS
jgi:hypothetical protein